MVAGLEEVTEGQILIDKTDVTILPPRKRDYLDGLSELCGMAAPFCV